MPDTAKATAALSAALMSVAGIPSARFLSASAVEQMGAHQAPVAAFDRRSPAVAAYAELWDEVLARLSGEAPPANDTASPLAQA